MLKEAVAESLDRSKLAQLLERRHQPLWIAALAVMAIALVSVTAYRVYIDYSPPPVNNEFDWERRGHSDFHNGSYYPSKCFLHGSCPYSPEDANRFLMTRAAATYSPIVFVLHLPFALLPLKTADIVFYICNVAMMMMIAGFCIRMSGAKFFWFDYLAILNLLLLSRPGHMTLFTGYFTAEIVIGCLLAIHFAHSRPVLSGLGMVLASIKPNFVIPLIIMMLWRRNFKAVAIGILFSAIAAGSGLAWLSYHNGVEQVVQDIRGGQAELHIDDTEIPINTWTRIDLLGMYAKLANKNPGDFMYLISMVIGSLLVGPIMYRLAPNEHNHGATGLTACILILAILVGIYHHSYDCLLLTVPTIGLLFYGNSTFREVPAIWRNSAGVLCAVPAFNYLSTLTVMSRLGLERLSFAWQAVTLINGVCLTLALLILVCVAIYRIPANGQRGLE